MDNLDLFTRGWLSCHRNLIYLVEKYPVTYFPSPTNKQTKLYKDKWDTAWRDIGMQLCQPSKTCKQLWTKIKFTYAKIMILINTRKIAKETAMSHPATAKFFDGLLSFMDPFLCTITDESIPSYIHKSVNDIFGLKTKQTKYFSSKKLERKKVISSTQLVTHTQVKALLKERQSKEDYYLDIMDTQYLQIVVDNAVKRKLEELLIKNDDLSNSSTDTINTINVPMTPSKNLQNVHKRKPSFTLIPSKNIQNYYEEHTTETVNLGLETELIIEDDMKTETEDDNIKMEDDIKEENLTLYKNINNTTDETFDLENILPSKQIDMPAVHDTVKNNISTLNNDVISIEYKTDDIEIMDNNEHAISDDYIRNFFKELGIVMSLELSTCKQKVLKSRINELLKDIFVKEEHQRIIKVDSQAQMQYCHTAEPCIK